MNKTIDKPYTGNAAILYNEQHSSIDEQAEAMRQRILAYPDKVGPSKNGTTYYISFNGNDENNGTSPETAWRTTDALREQPDLLKHGDVVLFERGGVYRKRFNLVAGVSYAAYGEGPKPCIYGGPRNYNDPALWEKSDIPNVWKVDTKGLGDVGNFVFDYGVHCAKKTLNLNHLTEDFRLYCDNENEITYLYHSAGNPGECYGDIELSPAGSLLSAPFGNNTDITLENLCLKYTGAHGIGMARDTDNITVRGCEIGWIGGSYTNWGVLGNGFEVLDNCNNIVAEDNWIYQCYDAGLTHQSGHPSGTMEQNIFYRNNLIEYCSYNIEYFVNSTYGKVKDSVYEGNILRFSGYGFGSLWRVESEDSATANINGWRRPMPCENFIIRNNILDTAGRYQLTSKHTNNEFGPTVTGNTWILDNQPDSAVALQIDNRTEGWVQRDYTLWARSKEEAEENVRKVDSAPKEIRYEEKDVLVERVSYRIEKDEIKIANI